MISWQEKRGCKQVVLSSLILTKEAIFAHKCDKLESDLQARLYSDDDSLKYEFAGDIKKNKDIEQLKQKAGDDIADMFCVWDRKHFEDVDDIFLKINKYLQGNHILKSKKVSKKWKIF